MEQNPQTFEFSPDKEGSAWSSLAFAWRRKGLVILALVVGLGLGYLYFLRQDPLYQSSTQIVVIEDQPRLPIEGLEMRAASEEMHVTLMRSQKVIEKAVEVGGLDQLATLRGSGNAVSTVMSRLKVSGGGNAKGAVMQLSYQSPHADECPKVLQAVVTAYEQFLDEMYKDVSQETTELIQQAKDQLEEQITKIEADLRKMLDESPLLVTGESALNIHEMRLQQIEEVRSTAVVENSRLQAKIDALQDALKRGVSRETMDLVIGNIEKADGQAGELAAKSDPLFALELERQVLLENHGPDHPKLKALDRRIEFMRDHLRKSQPEPSETGPPTLTVDYHQTYLASLSEQIKMNEQTIAEMTTLFDVERSAAKGLSIYQVKEETFRSEISRKSRLFDVVLKRLEEISLVQDRGGAEIQMIHPPARAGQIQPNLQSIMLQAGILSLLAGLGLAFVVDAADRRFRSPDEIRNDLGVPVIGHIPQMPGTAPKKRRGKRDKAGQAAEDDALPAELRTIHAPRGRIAEAYRAVRTAVCFSTRGGGHQVIQVTSPNPGDGKSTLAVNLAVSIANSGKRVLLVDADFRRPRVHKLLRLKNDAGMADVIEDSVEWLDAVQSTKIDNLSVLTCGKRPENPSELLTSRRFPEMLAAFREKFELVIIDTPPVMAVTDPLNVAPRVDGVLLVLRLSKSARSAAHRTLAALEEVGSNVLGVVVNGVGQGEHYGSYGYSKDGYSYGYGGKNGYGYGGTRGYGYGYGYGDDRTYYVDETDEETPANAEAKPHEGNGTH